MKLVVCALDDVAETARRHRPNGVVSLLTNDQTPPPIAGEPPRLTLRFHDIAAPREGLIAPDAEAVARLLAFAEARGAGETLLLHCWMGISRSPAAAFILACAAHPATAEGEMAGALRRTAPFATPNPLLVSLADDHLRRRGRMVAAISGIGRGRDSVRGSPFVLA
ncbi:MAG TPA: hypothetical protein VKQ54_12735 [Caulobacteraceae bacterium]|nr:hypothetical protein [Caulobacteraceae bacterium]